MASNSNQVNGNSNGGTNGHSETTVTNGQSNGIDNRISEIIRAIAYGYDLGSTESILDISNKYQVPEVTLRQLAQDPEVHRSLTGIFRSGSFGDYSYRYEA